MYTLENLVLAKNVVRAVLIKRATNTKVNMFCLSLVLVVNLAYLWQYRIIIFKMKLTETMQILTDRLIKVFCSEGINIYLTETNHVFRRHEHIEFLLSAVTIPLI